LAEPRDWLSWPAADIADFGRAHAAQAGLSARETASLILHMYLDAGLRPDGTTRPREKSDEDAVRRYHRNRQRRSGRQFAKDPVRMLATEARGQARRIRNAIGCLEYRSDYGEEAWLVPADMYGPDGPFALTSKLLQVANAMARAAEFGNVADQVRHAHHLGQLSVQAAHTAYRQPELDRLELVREKQRQAGGHNRKGVSMEERRAAYFKRLDEGLKPMYAAQFAAEDLTRQWALEISYDNVRSAFPNRRLPEAREA
jgi:hypothetical protein